MKDIIQFKSVNKYFETFHALKNISLNIPKGSFVTLLGPSGCGKTTLLRLLAGIYEVDEGELFVDNIRYNDIPMNERKLPLVFQDYALFPHLSVKDNITYGLRLTKVPSHDIERRLSEMIDMFELHKVINKFPTEISGGQQQRVAFARALIMEQDIILMDEPLSNLDAKLRVEVRENLRKLQKELGFTVVFVTHDQEEALSISDYIAVLNRGEIVQFGTPLDIYFHPKNDFVASFIGMANLVNVTVQDILKDSVIVEWNNLELNLKNTISKIQIGDQVKMVLRPEYIEMVDEKSTLADICGEISHSLFLGSYYRYWIHLDNGQEIIVDQVVKESIHAWSDRVGIIIDAAKIHLIKG